MFDKLFLSSLLMLVLVGVVARCCTYAKREPKANDLDALVPFPLSRFNPTTVNVRKGVVTFQTAGDRVNMELPFNSDHDVRLMQLLAWDPSALVYVTVGLDMKPGVAAVDDDGNGVVDDRGELGATGTDDRVLTPGDVGYQDAEAGSVMAAVLSRGAMRRVEGDAVIEGPGQVQIDAIDDKNQLVSRIIDLVGK